MQTLTIMNRTHEVCTVAYDDEEDVPAAYINALLKEGPLRNYTMRLITIEDSVDERIDRLIDRAYTVAEKFGL